MFDALNFKLFVEMFVYLFKFVVEFSWAIIVNFWWVILIFLGLEVLNVIIRGGHGITGRGRPRRRSTKRSSTYIDRNGYERFSDSGILVSRWMAEKKLRRKLSDEDVVHHKNRNKLDNSPENLWVFPNQAQHEQAHEADGDFDNDEV